MSVVIVLIITGGLLIALNLNAINKEKQSFGEVLNHKEKNMTNYEIEIGKLRREFTETILELQKDIEGLKDKIDEVQSVNSKKSEIPHLEQIYEENQAPKELISSETEDNNKNMLNDITQVSENNKSGYNSVKINEVNKMLNEGLSLDEIAEKIGIGKGEVLLIKELYIK